MTINEQIRSLCSRLRLYALPRLLESEAHLAQEQGKTHVEFLHDLLAREVQERDSKDFQRRKRRLCRQGMISTFLTTTTRKV
jgi:hypothetical protein